MPDFMRMIFLEIMNFSSDVHHSEVLERPPAPLHQRRCQNRAGRRIEEQFRDLGLLELQIVVGDDGLDIRWLSANWNFVRPAP